MAHFISEGLEIAYVDEGEGEPILLIHGFGSNLAVNWRSTGWIDTLLRDGRRVIAMDVRGHGNSAKPRDTALYRPALLAGDAGRLLDHLAIGRADVMGYSMGARIAAFLALDRPELIRSLVIGGLGTIFGPVVGAIILTPLGESLTGLMEAFGINAPGAKLIFYGIVLMIIISLRPDGVWPWLARHLKLDGARK